MRAASKHVAAPDSGDARFGRLAAFGVRDLVQLALLLPRRWDDFSGEATSINEAPLNSRAFFVGTVTGPLRVRRQSGPPRAVADFEDRIGTPITLIAFGASAYLRHRLPSGRVVLIEGTVRQLDRGRILSVEDIADARWIGRLRPVYPGKAGALGAASVREKVLHLLEEAIPVAAGYLRDALAAIADPITLLQQVHGEPTTFANLIRAAHLPEQLTQGQRAQATLERLAALIAMHRARTALRPAATAPALPQLDLRAQAAGLGFALTSDQGIAVDEIAADLRSLAPMRRVLMGATGTGKTGVYLSAAAAVVTQGVDAAILLPNAPLVAQVLAETQRAWPHLDLVPVTGKAKVIGPARHGARLFIGTTALLHRRLPTLGLLVVDEEHRFGLEQKCALLAPHTHLLLVSATCLPRSLALARFGALSVSMLREPPVRKRVITRRWNLEQRLELLRSVDETLARGDQVLVVYPTRGGDARDRLSVSEAAPWWERRYPGRVRVLTGDDTEADKAGALEDLRNGSADVVIATTVVQEGVNCPGLRQVVIVAPERYGLVTLHQLRGRVARLGGVGRCDLYSPAAVADDAERRLALLCSTDDAFELAEADLWARGVGDLLGEESAQSGLDSTILPGRPLRPAHLAAVNDYL